MAGDRAQLGELVGRFQEALASRDPARLPMARDVRYTEDGQELEIGDGFWGTASGVGAYRHTVLDPDTGQAGFFATMRENGNPVTLVGRLKAEAGQVTELETFLARPSADLGPMAKGAQALEALGAPDARWDEAIAEAERSSREALIASSDKYFAALQNNDGKGDYSFFADDCLRWENGLLTTLNDALSYGEGADGERIGGGERRSEGESVLAGFAAKSAREQFEVGYFAFVDRIRDRRFPVVDIERGLVFALGFFDHSGTVHRIPLADGRVIDGGVKEPFTWQIGEAFKVEGGRLTRIEAVMKRCPYGMKHNWPA